jgi:mono/diheme cytochrome c family protein
MVSKLYTTVAAALIALTSLPAGAETPIERGAYLVNAVMACDGCHTPRGPAGFAMDKRFSGGSQIWDEPAYRVKGSNISSDRDTGIGSWSADDVKRLLTEGVRPNGVPVAPQMPYEFYKIMTPGDLDAVVAYTRSVAPVRNEVERPVYKTAMHGETVPGAEKSIGDQVPSDPVKRGFYLATLAHCMECHARKPDGSVGFKDNYGRGGHVMTGPFGEVTVRNITSHPSKGVGQWSDAELKRALTHGVARDGRAFKLPMARQVYFSKMTDQDLEALVAWVRTIPPLE